MMPRRCRTCRVLSHAVNRRPEWLNGLCGKVRQANGPEPDQDARYRTVHWQPERLPPPSGVRTPQGSCARLRTTRARKPLETRPAREATRHRSPDWTPAVAGLERRLRRACVCRNSPQRGCRVLGLAARALLLGGAPVRQRRGGWLHLGQGLVRIPELRRAAIHLVHHRKE